MRDVNNNDLSGQHLFMWLSLVAVWIALSFGYRSLQNDNDTLAERQETILAEQMAMTANASNDHMVLQEDIKTLTATVQALEYTVVVLSASDELHCHEDEVAVHGGLDYFYDPDLPLGCANLEEFLEKFPMYTIQHVVGDVTCDNEITQHDVFILSRYVEGLEEIGSECPLPGNILEVNAFHS